MNFVGMMEMRSRTAVEPFRYIQIDQFLAPAECTQVLEVALAHRSQFVTSTTTTGAIDYRKSAVLYATHFPELYQRLRHSILQALPLVCQQLRHPGFTVTEVEMQMTAHNDGGYYKVHNDSGSEITATRELTYVYYFHRHPKAFSGGELCLYGSGLDYSSLAIPPSVATLEPRHNSMVFFPSHCDHEVKPIRCPSRQFADSRFTLNGWLRR